MKKNNKKLIWIASKVNNDRIKISFYNRMGKRVKPENVIKKIIKGKIEFYIK